MRQKWVRGWGEWEERVLVHVLSVRRRGLSGTGSGHHQPRLLGNRQLQRWKESAGASQPD